MPADSILHIRKLCIKKHTFALVMHFTHSRKPVSDGTLHCGPKSEISDASPKNLQIRVPEVFALAAAPSLSAEARKPVAAGSVMAPAVVRIFGQTATAPGTF